MKVTVTGTRGIPFIMGGVETHCQELFPRIAALGADVTVVRRSSYTPGPLEEWQGVRLVDIPTPRRKAFEAIVHTVRAVLYAKRSGADIVHINAIGPALATPLAKALGLKVVFTHHGPDYDRDKWGKAAKAALRLGERWGCRYADDVIVISDVIKELIASRCGRTERVHLIPNGVPVPEICAFPEYFAQLGIEPGKYVLGMSRFVPEKRLHELVEAFRRSGLADRGYKLVLAGDADFEDEYSRSLKAAARDAGAVLTGFISGQKLHSVLSGAALYVLPSSHEGLPIALLEAMSYGLPVVSSDIPANLEVGLAPECYFPLGDVDALSERLRSRTGEGRAQYDMGRYDLDSIASRTYEIYKGLCD